MQKEIISILSTITEDTTLPNWANGDTSIINDIGLDSLQLITFILTVEDTFSIQINFGEFDFEHLKSIHDFCLFLSRE